MDKLEDMVPRLFEKSIEAFLLAIETYNKPTIKYRVEAFAIFICNAWELLLKGHIINTLGSENIYYSDNPKRTINLENCIKKILTNDKDPLRLNLEKIIELRNTSTHLITEEYEMVYVPLFQACVLNYSEKLRAYSKIEISERIPLSFLTLSTRVDTLSEKAIRAKYPEKLATHLLTIHSELNALASQENNKFAIRIEHHLFITKDKEAATDTLRIAKDGEVPVAVLKKVSDPNETHKYTTKTGIAYIRTALKRLGTTLRYKGSSTEFNKFHFNNFCKRFGIKRIPKYCYVDAHDKNLRYFYSQVGLDYVVEELRKDADDILTKLSQKTTTPGAKEF